MKKASDVHRKLGKPESSDDAQDFFLISDVEKVQVVYDRDGKANTVSVTYSSNNETAPTVADVLGEDVPAGPDGRITNSFDIRA